MHVASIRPVTPLASPVATLAGPSVPTAPTVEQLRAELRDPFAFVAGSGCPWPGGKPPKG
jgi:hypothetical protein